MENQESLTFGTAPETDPRILEYAKFAESIGHSLVEKLEDIAEKARVAMHKLWRFKGAKRAAMLYVIEQNCYEDDFAKEWPDMSRDVRREEILRCADVAYEHLGYIQTLEPGFQAMLLRRRERRRSIDRGETPPNSPPNFVCPPSHKLLRTDSFPDPRWVFKQKKPMSRGQKLRQQYAIAGRKADREEAKRTGTVPRGKTRPLPLDSD